MALDKKEHLRKFGEFIYSYYKSIINTENGFYLVVDDFLFETLKKRFCEKENITPESIDRAYRAVKCNFAGDEYIALAIAVHQVKIVYEFNDNSVDEDRYNERLFNSLSTTYAEYWYNGDGEAPHANEALQEKLWEKLKDSFHILEIPANRDRGARNRYVQFPLSQKIINGSVKTFLVGYADVFLSDNRLSKEKKVSFVKFVSFLGLSCDSLRSEVKNRLIFHFYRNIWDGISSSDDYKRHQERINKRNVNKEKISENDDEYVVRYDIQNENNFLVYKNKDKINNIPLEIVSELGKSTFIFARNSSESNWWQNFEIFKYSEITAVLVIYKSANIKLYDCKTNEYGWKKIDEYFFIWFSKQKIDIKNETIRDILYDIVNKIGRRHRLIELVGGIKVKGFRNVWYSFALPVVRLSDYDGKTVYIDSKPQELSEFAEQETDGTKTKCKIIQLTNDMLDKIERHTVSLADFNSLDFYFYVAGKSEEAVPYQVSGWQFEKEKVVIPGQKDCFDIDGFTMNPRLNKINEHAERIFVQHLQRFDRLGQNNVGNNTIENWSRYGGRR